MLLIGLTGGIATGKSTVANMFGRLGAKIFNADSATHQLMNKPEIITAIAKVFPKSLVNRAIDRRILGDIVFLSEGNLMKLENIIHPEIEKLRLKFIQNMQKLGVKKLIFDIPLLFETNMENDLDYIITTNCPPYIQKQRAISRNLMTEEKYNKIITQQMPQYERINRADMVIETGLGKAHTMQQVKELNILFNKKQ